MNPRVLSKVKILTSKYNESKIISVILMVIFLTVIIFSGCYNSMSQSSGISGSQSSGISEYQNSDISGSQSSGINESQSSSTRESQSSSTRKSQSNGISGSQSSGISESQSSSISESLSSGITGITLIGPLHPVEQISEVNQEPCPDSVIIIKNKINNEEIKRTSVDKNGSFKISLPPGDYILDAKNKTGSVFPTSKPIDITVLPDKFTNITVYFDSGIR